MGKLMQRSSHGLLVRMVIHAPGTPPPDLSGMTDPVRLNATLVFRDAPGAPERAMSDLSARLRAAVRRLEDLDLARVRRDALAGEAERMKEAVRQSLSGAPGDDHNAPWRRTGALRGSIDAAVDEDGGAVGSNDPVAIDQELGTRSVPPRPFLAPAAAAGAPEMAGGTADAVARAIREALRGVAR